MKGSHEHSCVVLNEVGEQAFAFQECIILIPVGGPQRIEIVVRYDEETRTLSAELAMDDFLFKWQDWKDSFMGRLCAQKHWRVTRLSSSREHLLEEAGLSRIEGPVVCAAPAELGVDFELKFWSGWPPHLPQIALFEIKKLVHFFQAQQLWRRSYDECSARDFIHYIEYLNAALAIMLQSRLVGKTVYDNGNCALRRGRKDEALNIFGRCIAVHGHREALSMAANIVLEKNPVLKDQEYRLLSDMSTWYKVLLNRGSAEEWDKSGEQIDLASLADYFGRLYKATGNKYALEHKAMALFHKTGTKNPVSEEAIQTIESIFSWGKYSLYFNIYLAIAYQSRYQESKDQIQQQLAAKCLQILGTYRLSADVAYAVSIGYLLEKGYFSRRDEALKKELLRFCCQWQELSSARRIREIFERLFERDNDSSNEEAYDADFGVGRRPTYAIEVYTAVTRKDHTFHDKHFVQALNRLGLLYHRGAERIMANTTLAADHYLKAIDFGSHESLCNLGVLKLWNNADGNGMEYLEKAIEAENSTAMNNIAVAFELGVGVQRDAVSAERLYRQAIEINSNPAALYNLAIMKKFLNPNLHSEETSAQLISKLQSPDIDTSGLYILKRQVSRFTKSYTLLKDTQNWVMDLEEIDGSLAYVKALDDMKTGGFDISE